MKGFYQNILVFSQGLHAAHQLTEICEQFRSVNAKLTLIDFNKESARSLIPV